MIWLLLVLSALAVFITGIIIAATATPAPQSSARPLPAVLEVSTETLGQQILDKAETQAGCPYSYGHAGPCSAGFDCSGLVYWAATHLGLGLAFPRDTFSLLASLRLVPIPLSSARRGDLMFYGPGHVELNTVWYHTTFGAQTWGTRVGWHRWSASWHPTMAFRLLR